MPSPPGGESCPSARAAAKPVLRHLAQKTDHKVICAPCRRVACPVCWKRWRFDAAGHFASVLARGPGPLYAAAIPAKRWRAVQARVKREGGESLRVDRGGGCFYALADRPFPGAEALAPPAAMRALGAVLAAMPHRRWEDALRGKKVISATAGWRPPRKAKGGCEWAKVGATRAPGPEPVIEALEGLGLRPDVAPVGEWVVSYSTPPGDWEASVNALVALHRIEPDDFPRDEAEAP